ncbi:DNA polymerase III subunit gamma/tau domain-containing protein [Methylobacterium sp. CM6257]
MGAVISFFRPASTSQGGWSQQELAEFYRVEAALIRAGLQIGSEQGLSDEAEPWFVFCRPDGDAIMHFARIDGSYVIASEVLDGPVRGSDFRALINQVAQRYPELLPIPQGADGTKLSVHPAALLAALVAAAALSLSPHDARADDQDHSAENPFPASQAGQTLQHGPAGAGDSGDADERDSHRKQFGVIVFSAMVFAADALAADHVEQGTESGLYFGSQGSNSAASWEQGSVSVPTGGAVHSANSGAPLTSGSGDHAASGASGFITAEPTSAVPSQSGNADFGAIGLGLPTLVHGPARTSLEPAYHISTRAAEASTSRAAGSSSTPEAGSDAGAAASGDAEAAGQAAPSPSTTGEAASQTQSAPQAAGHSASEASPAQINGINATTQPELNHLTSTRGEDGSGRPDHAARTGSFSDTGGLHAASTVADAGHSGTSEGGSDQEHHGADGHGAANGANAATPSGASQAEADPGHAPAGGSSGQSAEAPGQLKNSGSDPHGADGHGAANGANAATPTGASQAGADPGHAPAGGSSGQSAEAPGQLKNSGSDPHGADGHGAANGANAATPTGASQAGADPGHAQAGGSSGQSAEAPVQLKETGNLRPHAGSNQPTDPAGSETPAAVSGEQPASTSQTSHASGQSQAQSPAARVDPAGNLVFAADGQHGQAAVPSHPPAEGGTHGDVGLIGVSDHGANAHHFDLHS